MRIKNIFGLTGSLGSRAEQELLSNIYNIDYAKLPTYKPKQFKEVPGVIAEDNSWHIQLILETITKVDQERAVLVICETEEDLLIIENDLKTIQDDSFRVRLYANEGDAKETREKVKIGDIILATNIAGRGTNFKTEKDLEANGGLHVCVGFLPCNLRVEGQAFGRTSRQGNNGTAQLVIVRVKSTN
jgi:preprotein translocase subunit SecA